MRHTRRGATIWLTGLPGSGKTTLARGVERRLAAKARLAYVLDGDAIRSGLCSDLGYDADSRNENVRRVSEVAALFADAGVIAVVALISPSRSGRAQARALHDRMALPFLEVFVDTPLEICEQRDPKGHYSLARRGLLKAFTGIDAPYERPVDPDLVVRPAADPIELGVDCVVGAAERIIARPGPG
nr:adenylyl-sulfate kinase [Solirubrobacter soli]